MGQAWCVSSHRENSTSMDSQGHRDSSTSNQRNSTSSQVSCNGPIVMRRQGRGEGNTCYVIWVALAV